MKCRICDEIFDDESDAIEHAHDNHSDTLDELLNEYISDAEQDFLEQYIE